MFIIDEVIKQLKIAFFQKDSIQLMDSKESVIFFLKIAVFIIPIYIILNFVFHSYSTIPLNILNTFLTFNSKLQVSNIFIPEIISPFLLVLLFYPLTIIVNFIYFTFFGTYIFKVFNHGYSALLSAAVYAAANAVLLRWLALPFEHFNSLSAPIILVITGLIWPIAVFFYALVNLENLSQSSRRLALTVVMCALLFLLYFLLTLIIGNHPIIQYFIQYF
ncbi:MAG: hypothetical protein M1331_03425 [Candidatus Marsarchaeota archaeon]|nr:hypothetical protein [Candidatus Marsarchaeota archaeon]